MTISFLILERIYEVASTPLSQKLKHLLAEDGTQPPLVEQRRPQPKTPKHGIPSSQWPHVFRRVMEKHEPLRTVADEYGVSYETGRRESIVAPPEHGQKKANLYKLIDV